MLSMTSLCTQRRKTNMIYALENGFGSSARIRCEAKYGEMARNVIAACKYNPTIWFEDIL